MVYDGLAATQAEMVKQNYAAVGLRKLGAPQPQVSGFPFVTAAVRGSPNAFTLLPQGDDKSDETNFCHSNTVVNYDDDDKAKPIRIAVYMDEDHWTFDFSQVLRHADQFVWKSGVFSDSSDTYLSAVKGNCTLQFVVSTGAAKLYRVMYDQ
jgi:hypothetical protein